MCFSASASFVTATFLALSAAVTFGQLKSKHFLFIAALPLFFAIQQFIEGIVWLSFANAQLVPWRVFAVKGFLFFAFIIWPVWIPLSLLAIEQKQKNKKLLRYCLRMGLVVSVCLAFFFIGQQITARIDHNHIQYTFQAPMFLNVILTILYLCAAVVPFFIASIRNMRWFGSALLLSYIVSYIFYAQVHISVWCFFAAVLSFLTFAFATKHS